MIVLLMATAAILAGWLGHLAQRSEGWSPGAHRAALVALLVPWFVQHASVARLARSPSLNPLRRAASESAVLAGDLVGPVLVGLGLVACLVWVRRLRGLSIFLPLMAESVLWWVTLPLYQRSTLRGWFFLTEGLAGPWPLTHHLAASAFLAGFTLPSWWPRREGASGGTR